MAIKKLGASAPTATTNTTVYTVPALKSAVANINLVNTGAATITVRLAIAATGTPGASEWIEYGATITPYGVLERTGIAMSAAENVVVYTDIATLAVRVHGVEE
jgi:hypothetical protein